MEEDLVQPAKGTAEKLYYKIRYVFMAGFFEILFGAAAIVVEVAAIAMFKQAGHNFPLEMVAIGVGICFILIGGTVLTAGRHRVLPQTRRKLFISGCVLSLAAFTASLAFFILCVLRAHYLWLDVEDKKNRTDASGKSFRDVPYILSIEGMSHHAILRSIAAVIYAPLIGLFLYSAFLCGMNIRKNRENMHSGTSTYTAVETNPFKFPSSGAI